MSIFNSPVQQILMLSLVLASGGIVSAFSTAVCGAVFSQLLRDYRDCMRQV